MRTTHRSCGKEFATNQLAKEHFKQEKERAKQQYDKTINKRTFKLGDKVLLYNETVRRGRSKKLEPQWIGPYVIIEKNSDLNYTIKRGRQIHANRIKSFIDH